jgi:hypothetical protein
VFVDFKSQVGAQIADSESKDIGDFRGGDWWQLTDEEESVFAIDFERFPRMSAAWMMFEVFLDQVSPGSYELDPAPVEDERGKRPDLVEKGNSVDAFQHFARDYAGLTFREAAAMHAKAKFWNIRQGAIRYADESPTEE